MVGLNEEKRALAKLPVNAIYEKVSLLDEWGIRLFLLFAIKEPATLYFLIIG
jgi:hypothetical protein